VSETVDRRPARDLTVPDRMPVARGRVLGRPDPLVWPVLGLALVLGTAAYLLLSDRPAHAAGSYAGAIAIVVACLGTATMNVRLASRISPPTMMLAGIFSYVFTVAVLSFAWLLSTPRVVVGPAVLVGTVVAVVVWTAGVARASWVR
jgi:hypothetical protein